MSFHWRCSQGIADCRGQIEEVSVGAGDDSRIGSGRCAVHEEIAVH